MPGGDLDRREARVHPIELCLPSRHRLHDRLDVDGRLPGLTELLVRHQAFLLVEDRHEPVVGLGHDGSGRGALLDPVEGVQVEVVGEVELARLHLGDPRRHLGHGHPAELVGVGGLASAVPVGLFVARLVVVEAHHADVLVGLPLRQLVGARADVLGGLHGGLELLGDLLGIDGAEVVGHREGDQDDGRLLLEPQVDGVLVDDLDVGDLGEERLAVDRLLAPADERGRDVLGRHLLAVVELDALAELEGVDEPVLAHGVAFREHRDGLLVLVQAVEPLVDVVGEGLGDAGGGPVSVQRRRLPEIANTQDAALDLGSRVRHRSAGEDDGEREDGERGTTGKRSGHASTSGEGNCVKCVECDRRGPALSTGRRRPHS